MHFNFNNKIIIFWITFFLPVAIVISKYHTMRRNIYTLPIARVVFSRLFVVGQFDETMRRSCSLSAHTHTIRIIVLMKTRHRTNQSPKTIAIYPFQFSYQRAWIFVCLCLCLRRFSFIVNTWKGRKQYVDECDVTDMNRALLVFIASTLSVSNGLWFCYWLWLSLFRMSSTQISLSRVVDSRVSRNEELFSHFLLFSARFVNAKTSIIPSSFNLPRRKKLLEKRKQHQIKWKTWRSECGHCIGENIAALTLCLFDGIAIAVLM